MNSHQESAWDLLQSTPALVHPSFFLNPWFSSFCTQYLRNSPKQRLFADREERIQLEQYQSNATSYVQRLSNHSLEALEMLGESLCWVKYDPDEANLVKFKRFIGMVEEFQSSSLAEFRSDRLIILCNDRVTLLEIEQKLQSGTWPSHCLKAFQLAMDTGDLVSFPLRQQEPVPRTLGQRLFPARWLRWLVGKPAPSPSDPFSLPTSETPLPADPLSELATGIPETVIVPEFHSAELRLGRKIGGGGEGQVFEAIPLRKPFVEEPCVVKIYQQPEGRNETYLKLKLLMTRRLWPVVPCSWPIGLACDPRTQKPIGYVMRRASGDTLAATLGNPALFRRNRPGWTRRQSVLLAIHLLTAIERLHRMNVLLGDLNSRNILIKTETEFSLVDCDSFQVENFPSRVGISDFDAPENVDRNPGTFFLTKNQELFSVATLLFHILIPGQLPYNRVSAPPNYRDRLREGIFPYQVEIDRCQGVPLGPWLNCWSHLPKKLRAAFVRTFDKSMREKPRLPIRLWIRLLQNYHLLLFDMENTFLSPMTGYDLNILPPDPYYFNP